MTILENLFIVFSGGLAVAGLTMVKTAVKAYFQTERRMMIHLSIGFGLIVTATVATATMALLNDFQNPRTLLLVNNGFTMCGYLFVMYSVVSYR